MLFSHRRSDHLKPAFPSSQRRRAIFESLEDRRLLTASPGSDAFSHLDVNRDGTITELDALQVINVLQADHIESGSGKSDAEPRHDVNQDGKVSAVDALWVINFVNDEDTRVITQSLQSEPAPTASISLPGQIRARDIAELTIHSINDLDLSTIDYLEIDWGDGRVTEIKDNLSQPLIRLHSYFIDPATAFVEVRAVPHVGSAIVLQNASIDVVANSPFIVDRANEGLTAEVYDNTTFTGPSVSVRTDPTIDFDFGVGSPDPNLNIGSAPFSIRWQGQFNPIQTTNYTFFAEVGENDTVDFYLDNQLLFTASDGEQSATILLTEDQSVDLKVDYVAGAGVSKIRVGSETGSSFKTALPRNQLLPLVPANQLRSGVLVETFEPVAPSPPLSSIAELRDDETFVANTPSTASDISSFSYSAVPGEKASRIRGIVSPPVSGHYTFHLAASDEAELWLSQGVTSDTSRLIASVATPTLMEGFTDANAGLSASVYLVAGQDYYIETLQVHDDPVATNHLSVAWTRPDQLASGPQLIGNEFLRPIVPQVSLHAEISQTNEVFSVDPSMRFVVKRDDDLGRDLPVAYTLGGSATNGADYLADSGTVIIPAGQRSAEIELVVTKDGLPEPTETVVVRLVADPAYQLGSEFTRQVTGTINGEAIGGAESLPPDPILLSSFSYYDVDSTNAVVEFEETDSRLPFVDAVPGNNAIRVDVNSFSNPWDIAFSHTLQSTEIVDGDKLFVSVWARSANLDGSPVTVGMRLQESGRYYGSEQTWEVDDEWTPLLWPIVADFNGNATASRGLDIRVGYQQQSVELAGLSLMKLPASTDMTELPRSIFSYKGRDADAAWRTQARMDEQTQRTHPVQIIIQDSAGNPVEGAVVTITPQDQSLPVAMAVSPSLVVPSSDPALETPESARYRAIIETYFSTLTDGGEAQWGPWEEDSQLPTDFLQWVVDRDLSYHGHAIVWGELDRFPAPDDLIANYEQMEASQGSEVAKTWLENEILTHVATGPASAFSGTRDGSDQPLVTWWDVINHPILSDDIWNIVGDDFMLDVMEAARSVVHPDTRLIINEFDVLSNPDFGQSDDFFDLLSFLDAQSISGRADFDTIGFQGHFLSERLPAIDRVLAELDRYESFGRDFQITEFDVDAMFIDEQTQADFTRDIYAALASNENVSLLTPWGFWEGDHWRSEEEAAFYRQDWTPKPNGQWLLDQTTESLFASTTWGPLTFNGKASEYLVQVAGETFEPTTKIIDAESQNGVQTIAINYLPIAMDDTVTTLQDTPIAINVLADNGSGVDSDSDGELLTIQSTTQPTHGTLVVDSIRDIIYTPNVGFAGVDTFEYTISDGNGASATARVSVSVTPSVVDLAAGLVSFWDFNGDGLDSALDGVKSDDGNFRGSAVIDPSGLGGGSLRLTDSTSSFAIESSDDINTAIREQYSVAFWFYADDISGNQTQVLYEQGGVHRGLNAYLLDGRLYAGGWNVTASQSNWQGNWIDSPVTAGQWHHVAVSLDGSASVQPNALTLWLDGTPVDSVPGSRLWEHSDDIGVGAVNGSTRFHDGTPLSQATWHRGLIDDLRIYDRVIKSTDVSLLASMVPANTTSDLVAYWDFDRANGSIVADNSLFGTDNSGHLIGNALIDPSGLGDGSLRVVDDSSRFAIPNSADINLGIHDQLSVSFWFFADDLSVNGKQVLYEQGGGSRGLNLYLFQGRLFGGAWNLPDDESGWTGDWIDVSVEQGTWNHVTLSLEGSESVQADALTMWLNGVIAGSGSGSLLWGHSNYIAAGQVDAGTRFHDAIGSNATWFRGLIDNMQIHARSLKYPDVATLADADVANLTSGLVAHWSFDQADGATVPDSSLFGSDHSGLLIGNAVIDPSGLGNGSLRLLDGNSRFSVPNSLDINQGRHDDISLAFWFYPDDLRVAGKQVLYEQGGATRGLNLYLFEGRLYGGAWNLPNSESGWEGSWIDVPIVQATWNHVTLRLSGTDEIQDHAISLWLNGQKVDDAPGSRLWDHPNAVAAGHADGGTLFHDGTTAGTTWLRGLVDELRIYDRAVSSVDIKRLGQGQPQNFTSGGDAHHHLSSMLIGYWPLDETSSNVVLNLADDSRNGVLSGSFEYTTDGRVNGSLQPGSGVVFSDNLFNVQEKTFTFSVWTRTDQPDGIVAFGESATAEGDYWRLLVSDGRPAFRFDTGDGVVQASGPDSIDDGKWHHLAAVRYGSHAARLYVDGELVDQQESTGAFHSLKIAPALYVGGNAQSPYNGFVDEIAFYRRALEPHNVHQLYRLGSRPIAFADRYALESGVEQVVAIERGLLANDFGSFAGSLSATLNKAPRHGNLTLNSDGSFVYQSVVNYTGIDSFSYWLGDGRTEQDLAVVNLSIYSPQQWLAVKNSVRATALEGADQVTLASLDLYSAVLNSGGQFTDLDYLSDTSVALLTHASRVSDMARAYSESSHARYQSNTLRQDLIRAITFLSDSAPDTSSLPNWFHRQIGFPNFLWPALVLMGSEIDSSVTAAVVQRYFVDPSVWDPLDVTDRFGGMNVTYRARNAIAQAVIMDDPLIVPQIVSVVINDLRYRGRQAAGLRPDNSFHQHSSHPAAGVFTGETLFGDALQWSAGSYGIGYAYSLADLIPWLHNTALSFPPEVESQVVDYVLDGQRWLFRGAAIEPTSQGRSITQNEASSPSREVVDPAGYMATVAAKLQVLGTRVEELAQFETSLVQLGIPSGVAGNTAFWSSDVMVQQQDQFMASVRMLSQRTIRPESAQPSGQLEGAKSYFLADGVTTVYQDGTEYRSDAANAIFPIWNWSRLPGTTLEQLSDLELTTLSIATAKDARANIGTGQFVGSVSNGVVGMAAMDYGRPLGNVTAKKSWFFFAGGFVALGADIHSSNASNQVNTTLAQVLSDGPTLVHSSSGDETTYSQAFSITASDTQWTLHDGVGYVLLGSNDTLNIEMAERTGNWNEIGLSEGTVTDEVFSVWIDHGIQPSGSSYSYAVIPGSTPESLNQMLDGDIPEVLSNNSSIQAVRHAGTGVSQVAFFEPASLALSADIQVQSDSAVLMQLIELPGGDIELSVSDPTGQLANAGIEVRRSLATGGYKSITLPIRFAQGIKAGKSTVIRFHLPVA
ncbi:MAG: PA14 domain-containing protein [bacterium]|jgi:endo-1,4-beta-xylanase|nr:PA14 domain-containing protein [bacterium]